VDGADFIIRPFKDEVAVVTLGIAQSRSLKPRQVVQRLADFCAEWIGEGPAPRLSLV
jgi:3-methyladenine DNA glycosylase AlkC